MSSRLSRVSFGIPDDADNYNSRNAQKRPLGKYLSTTTTATTYEKKPGFGLINFFTLRVLIFDIGVALGDVITDFAQVSLTFNI